MGTNLVHHIRAAGLLRAHGKIVIVLGIPINNAIFCFQNMFLAIINDTYSEVKDEVNNRREEFQVIEI